MTAWIVISFSRLLCMRPEIQRMKHCTGFFLVWCGLHFIVDVWHHRILSPVVYSQINLCKVNIIAGIGSAHLKWAYCLEPLYGCNMDVSRCPLNCWFFTEIVAYQELFCLVMLLMSLSNHSNNEENEKIKQAAGLTSKTKTLNMQHTFWQFFAINANIVKLDQNGNAIIPLNLTFKIVVNIHYDFSFFGNTHREALPYRESKNMTK